MAEINQKTEPCVGVFTDLRIEATLNSKYNLYPNEMVPNKKHGLLYFGVGTGGIRPDGDLYMPGSNDLDLYNSIPIRCRPIDQDLQQHERYKYRMRVLQKIQDQWYWCYYLKLLMAPTSVGINVFDEETPILSAPLSTQELLEWAKATGYDIENADVFINEWGLYSGVDQTVKAFDLNLGIHDRTEALGVRLSYKQCTKNVSIYNDNPSISRLFRFGCGD